MVPVQAARSGHNHLVPATPVEGVLLICLAAVAQFRHISVLTVDVLEPDVA